MKTAARHQECLQRLYWPKQELVQRRSQIAQLSTINRWLNAYCQGRLKQLLEIKTLPTAARLIPPEVMAQLQARLQDPNGLESDTAIGQWLRQEHQRLERSLAMRWLLSIKFLVSANGVPLPTTVLYLAAVGDAF